MLLDWKNQYFDNDYTTQGNLQIQCNLYQVTNGNFYRTRPKYLKVCLETQKTQKSQSNTEKTRAGGIRLPDLRWYHKATVIKMLWFWHQNRQTDQWNRIERLEWNPHTHGQLTYDKGSKNAQQRKTVTSISGSRRTGQLHVKEWNENTHWHQTQTQNALDLNRRQDTIKLLEEITGQTLSNINHSTILSDPPPGVITIKTNGT